MELIVRNSSFPVCWLIRTRENYFSSAEVMVRFQYPRWLGFLFALYTATTVMVCAVKREVLSRIAWQDERHHDL